MAGETIKMRTILEGTTAQRIRPANVRFGSFAVIHYDITPMSAFGHIADVQSRFPTTQI